MRTRVYPRFKSFDFADVLDRMTEPSETEAQMQVRFQILRDQLARSENELSDRMGEVKYAEWRANMIRPLDDLGEQLQKIDAELARQTCPYCPFDHDPGMCGICHEHRLGDRPLPFDYQSDYVSTKNLEESNV